MRVRALDANGDMTFGKNAQDFLVNSPEMVGQCIQTRLKLFTNEWFLNLSDGTPWASEVLGKYTRGLYDAAIQNRILGSPGVLSIVSGSYSSVYTAETRALAIACTVNTQYGQAPVAASI
jgi:hypothetical protein